MHAISIQPSSVIMPHASETKEACLATYTHMHTRTYIHTYTHITHYYQNQKWSKCFQFTHVNMHHTQHTDAPTNTDVEGHTQTY